MGIVRRYFADASGNWKRSGWTTLSGSSRDSLTYGTYEPTLSTAGLLSDEASLTDYNSSAANTVTIPDSATPIVGKIIYGKVTFAGVADIRDCLFVGPATSLTSGNDGVLTCTNTRAGIAKITDCEIRPRAESAGRNCILGWQFEAYRTWMHGGEDAVGIYNTTGANANVKVKGCILEDLAYTYPDRDHADGSHTDCIQIQGGFFTEIIGNAIRGTAHYMSGSGTYFTANPSTDLGDWPLQMPTSRTAGAGIIINGNVSAVNSTVIIDSNYFRFCKSMLLVKNLADGFVVTNNRFSSIDTPAKNVNGTVRGSTTLTFTANEYFIRFDAIAASSPNVSGLTSSGALANTTNVWLDGANAGVALSTPRASGVHTDA